MAEHDASTTSVMAPVMGPVMADAPRIDSPGGRSVVIAIPTYRRPQGLARLLETLEPELPGHRVAILVGDNDASHEDDAPGIVRAFSERTGVRADCFGVADRGISAVRNALIERAIDWQGDWEWLVMLDDDGLVEPGWLAPLLDAAVRFDADALAGPVTGSLPMGAGRLARNSAFAGRSRFATGPVATLNGAQNLALARRLVDHMPAPWFRNDLGLTGGEDYEFFRRLKRNGARLVWCDEAAVCEPTPRERLTARALMSRYLSTGATMARIDRDYDGAAQAWRTAMRGLAGATLRLAGTAARAQPDPVARQLLMMVHYAGRLTGLLGLDKPRYASPPAPR